MNLPFAVFVISFLVLFGAAHLGAYISQKRGTIEKDERDDFGVIIAAALTLLGLIIGFSFSMATTRYDQRKNYEEEEANAIGTEYLRVQVLPPADAVKIQQILRNYTDQRILFYRTKNRNALRQVNAETSRLQAELWNGVHAAAMANPTCVTALAVSGMNDVINRQGYTQAAWWNRIPTAAWGLMMSIAFACNVLIGYTSHSVGGKFHRFSLLPLIVAIAFLLIADIDSPRGGLIHVRPQNLESLANSLRAQ
jgi:protein-S-isoprenylcysteine O-methyltransferase Ste14